MSLDEYRSKRQLKKTPEPPGGVSGDGGGHNFVIQEHHARRLHFDLRLEINGVLKSWAVPKGPSLDPRDKRLAVQTEDHPLEYLTFEGTIPEGNYGAGKVAVWDTGSYEVIDPPDPAEGISNGKLSFRLKGARLGGEFHLVRTKQAKDSWLLLKKPDEWAIPGWKIEPILTDTHKGHGLSEAATVVMGGARKQTVAIKIGKPAPFPDQIEPMLATLVEKPFDDPGWLFEVKWDGYRSICYVDHERIRFISRGHLELGEKFPDLVTARSEIAAQTAVLDGEILALNPEGKPDFQLMQNASGFRAGPNRSSRPSLTAKPVLVYYAFDLLYCNGRDLRDEPLVDRKRLLAQIITDQGRIRFSDHVEGKGILLFQQVRDEGMEGIMAKDSRSKYEQHRSKRWLKIKTAQTMEVVIGGYTEGRGSRSPFGALLLGLYDKGELRHTGNVGGGFSEESLKKIYEQMQPLRIDESPFQAPPKTEQKPLWLRPELVCEVRFQEVTDDGKLRQPIFMRLREDKDPRTCTLASQKTAPVKEKPASSAKFARSAVSAATVAQAEEFFAGNKLQGNHHVGVEGFELALTNLEKVYWPDAGLTKGDLVRYCYRIAETILPHLKDRPLVLKRYPGGIEQEAFYQHNVEGAPPFVKTWTSPANDQGERVTYALCNNRATLVYLANLGAIQLSPWHSRHMTSQHPDYAVLDLDPGPEVKYPQICRVALLIRDILTGLGLQSYPKTSGSRGIHIYIPLEPDYTHEQSTAFAEIVARTTQKQNPKETTVERLTKNRPADAVYLDYLQNGFGKTLVGVYTARARPGATVSAPLSWEEVRQCVRPREFTIKTMIERIGEAGDLFRPVLTKKQGVLKALEKLQAG